MIKLLFWLSFQMPLIAQTPVYFADIVEYKDPILVTFGLNKYTFEGNTYLLSEVDIYNTVVMEYSVFWGNYNTFRDSLFLKYPLISFHIPGSGIIGSRIREEYLGRFYVNPNDSIKRLLLARKISIDYDQDKYHLITGEYVRFKRISPRFFLRLVYKANELVGTSNSRRLEYFKHTADFIEVLVPITIHND